MKASIAHTDGPDMPHADWHVAEHCGPDGLLELEADWRRLYGEMRSPQIWHSYEAYSAYIEHLAPVPADFRCLALSDGERVRSILPLEARMDRGLFEVGVGIHMNVVGMPFRKESWALNDAIGPEDDAQRVLLPLVIDHLRTQPDRPAILALGRTRESSRLWEGLQKVPFWRWFAFTDVNEFLIRTDMSVEAFTARLSRNTRQMLSRAARRFEALEGAGDVYATSPEALAAEIDAFLDVEASGWKGQHGTAIRQNPGEERFYRDLLVRLRLDGHCEIHSLYAEGRCIASGFWVCTGRERALLKCGYVEDYAAASPGRLLTHRSLERCCADAGVDAVSMFGDAPWLRHWHPESAGARRAYVSLRPLTGTLLLAALRLRYGPVRRLTRMLRARHDRRVPVTSPQRGSESG